MQSQLVNFTIPKKFLVQADNLARKESHSRSELFREAIRRYLQEQTWKKEDFTKIKKAAERINLDQKQATAMMEKTRNELPLNQ